MALAARSRAPISAVTAAAVGVTSSAGLRVRASGEVGTAVAALGAGRGGDVRCAYSLTVGAHSPHPRGGGKSPVEREPDLSAKPPRGNEPAGTTV